MRYLALAIIAVVFVAGCTSTPVGEPVTIYRDARVWSGDGFEKRAFAVAGDRFVPLPRGGPGDGTVVSLDGQYVIPALGNAHHHITNANDGANELFLRDGIYYAWNPNTLATAVDDETRTWFARADTYDARQALGGITEPGGHPEKLYVDILAKWVYKGKDLDYFLGNAFHFAVDETAIDAALDLLVSQQADFVKIYILHSEDYAARRDDDEFYGRKGLNPDNVDYLVSAAHARDLPVVAHIETTADFRAAVAAGVDALMHLPGYTSEKTVEGYARKKLTADDAAAAARAGVWVVPTYNLARAQYEKKAADGEPVAQDLIHAHYGVQAHNLAVLHAAGVPILTGTDADIGVHKEVSQWIEVGGLSREDALQAALATGSHLFPDRRIGRIQPGFEANFLVLREDPRERFAPAEQISMRFKAGQQIQLPAPQP
ncbi:MAG: amidohydrolase family protein [Gammaproteobacteria bacterium]|nr:amidohydrolase family protein [Gammaproteobacteria bacterium]